MRQAGFTLIELLIALTIFAILSALSYRSLNSLFITREMLAAESASLRDHALFFSRIDNDTAALLSRSIINADGNPEPPLFLTSFPARADSPNLSFTRTGYLGADEVGSAPQRVGYRLREGNIDLLLWNGVDHAPRATPSHYPALKDVREARWRAMDANGNWQTEWPPAQHAVVGQDGAKRDPFPRALEIVVTFASGEKITRAFPTRRMDERLQ